MPIYEAASVIEVSLRELEYIARLVAEHEDRSKARTVLIGGWAVHSYNPWYGSIDIDLITDTRGKKRILDGLVNDRGFERYRDMYERKGISKTVAPGRKIIIDFGTRNLPDPFEGTSLALDYEILDGRTVEREIVPGTTIHVPDRAMLIVLKLKAAWDREHRIANSTSHDREWERGKLLKDRGDLMALLDPERGGSETRIEHLGSAFKEWPFLREVLYDALDDRDALASYGRMSLERIEDLQERLNSLLT